MNKSIELRKNCIILFLLNIGALLLMILFKSYFSSVGYSTLLINIMLGINIVFLATGIVFNFILFARPNKFDEKRSIILMGILFSAYVLINTVGMVIINKPLSSGYKKIADQLTLYCDTYVCDRYETINQGGVKDFIIRKTYLDYNGVSNDIEIHTKYDSSDVISVQAIVYSQNEMFSEMLIKEQIKVYFDNFEVNVSETLIKDAFDNRFKGSIKKDNLDYKVSEVYEDGELIGLKTIITLRLKQD